MLTCPPLWYARSEIVPCSGFARCLALRRCLDPVIAAVAHQARKLDPVLLENLKEILNVCSQLFMESEVSRVNLLSVLPGSQSAEEVQQLMAAPRQRVDLKVSVEGYGEGKVSFLT